MFWWSGRRYHVTNPENALAPDRFRHHKCDPVYAWPDIIVAQYPLIYIEITSENVMGKVTPFYLPISVGNVL